MRQHVQSASHVVDSRLALIESALPGAAIGPEVQGMQVDVSVATGQLDTDRGQPVGRHREAPLLKGGDRRLDRLGRIAR